MRKKYVNICLFSILCFFANLKLYGQNPILLVGNQYFENDGTGSPSYLPNGPTSMDYQGLKPWYSANAWHNPVTGQLLFFIADGKVYDEDGFLINELRGNVYGANRLMRGTSEVVIVPDPGNCQRFYIFSGFSENLFSNTIPLEPCYAILDLSLPRLLYNTSRTGDLVEFSASGNYLMPLLGIVPSNQIFDNSAVSIWWGVTHLAVTPLDNNNEHFLVCQSSYDLLYGFIINSNGIEYVNNSVFNIQNGSFPTPLVNPIYSQTRRSELEIRVKDDGGYIVAGFTVPAETQPDKVFKVEYSAAKLPIQSTYVNYSFPISDITAVGQGPVHKGIEFSPNGDYMYLTHTLYFLHPASPKAIVCLDANTLEPIELPLISIQQSEPFMYSMIELNGANQMLMAREDGIYEIVNPNNPSLAYIQLFLPFSPADYLPFATVGLTPARGTLFLLPDQMDFDPNCQIACYDNCNFNSSDAACCEFYSGSVFVPESNIIEINTATVWEPSASGMPFTVVGGVGVVSKNIVVKPGASLTINNLTLEFFNEKQITVERDANTSGIGGRLYVNNSNLTVNANCGNCTVWGGIVLQGHTSVSPSSTSHAYAHINNSNIEHASTAIHSSAGQLLVHESTFKNNSRSISLSPYNHPYQCNIYRSHFFTDGLLNNPVEHPIVAHIVSPRPTTPPKPQETSLVVCCRDNQR